MNTAAQPGPVVRYHDVPDSPWRNGNGQTREIHRGDGWRLSIATIAAAGEFSRFPEIDRIFVLAQGVLELTVNGVTERLAAEQVTAFPGEAPVAASPQNGPAVAVNIMTERGRCRAGVTVRRLSGAVPPADALVVLTGSVTGPDGTRLGPLDTLAPAPAAAGPASAAPTSAAPTSADTARAGTAPTSADTARADDALVVLISVARASLSPG